MVMEGLIMRYCVTMEINGKAIQVVHHDPVSYFAGYLQAMLDNNQDVIIGEGAIRQLKDKL